MLLETIRGEAASPMVWEGTGCCDLRSVPGDAQDHQGAVIVRFFGAAAELIRGAQYCGADVFGRGAGFQSAQNLSEPFEAELFVARVHVFQDSVGGKNQQVLRL